jgi:hypothetical protein
VAYAGPSPIRPYIQAVTIAAAGAVTMATGPRAQRVSDVASTNATIARMASAVGVQLTSRASWSAP